MLNQCRKRRRRSEHDDQHTDHRRDDQRPTRSGALRGTEEDSEAKQSPDQIVNDDVVGSADQRGCGRNPYLRREVSRTGNLPYLAGDVPTELTPEEHPSRSQNGRTMVHRSHEDAERKRSNHVSRE